MRFKLRKGVFEFRDTNEKIVADDPNKCYAESDKDLCKLYPNKWDPAPEGVASTVTESEKLDPPTIVGSAAKEAAAKEKEEKPVVPAPKKSSKKDKPDLGIDITDKYPNARDADLLVLQNGETFNVVDKDDSSMPLNKKPLAEKELPAFIAKYLKPAS